MEKLIEKLSEAVEDAKTFGEDPDDMSWNLEVGVLITANEATQIIEALRPLNEAVEYGQATDCKVFGKCDVHDKDKRK